MKPNWFRVCNAVEAEDEAEVLIYDEIGLFGITAKQFIDELRATGAKRFHVRLNSPGGDVFDGISIYNYLRGQNCRVTVDGLAGSIASVIAMAGKTICMAESSMMMIHNPWGIVVGDSADARKLAEGLDKIRDQIVKAYVRRTGQTEAQIRDWMDEETWMDAADCVERGFADQTDAAIPARDFAVFNLTRFKHVPVDIIAQANMNLQEALAKIAELEPQLTSAKSQLTTLTAERDGLKAHADRLPTVETELTTVKAAVTAKESELATVKAQLQTEKDGRAADQTAAAAALEAEKTSVQAKVDEELAKLGQRRLATGAGEGATALDQLREQARTEKDSVKLGEIAQKIRALKFPKAA